MYKSVSPEGKQASEKQLKAVKLPTESKSRHVNSIHFSLHHSQVSLHHGKQTHAFLLFIVIYFLL